MKSFTRRKQKGASMVEYALLIALIAVIALVAVKTLGRSVSGKFSGIASTLDAEKNAGS